MRQSPTSPLRFAPILTFTIHFAPKKCLFVSREKPNSYAVQTIPLTKRFEDTTLSDSLIPLPTVHCYTLETNIISFRQLSRTRSWDWTQSEGRSVKERWRKVKLKRRSLFFIFVSPYFHHAPSFLSSPQFEHEDFLVNFDSHIWNFYFSLSSSSRNTASELSNLQLYNLFVVLYTDSCRKSSSWMPKTTDSRVGIVDILSTFRSINIHRFRSSPRLKSFPYNSTIKSEETWNDTPFLIIIK